MKKTLMVGVAIVIVAVVAVSVTNKNHKNKAEEDIRVERSSVESKSSGTLKDFMSGALGLNMTCELTQSVGKDNEIRVKTYISGKKTRVDYSLKDPVSGQRDLHIISDGEYGYVWGDSLLGNAMGGMKINLKENPESDGEGTDIYETAMIDEGLALSNCKRWSPDASLFDVPGDVKFLDPNNLEDLFFENVEMPQDIEKNCSICYQMGAEADSCLYAMGCK